MTPHTPTVACHSVLLFSWPGSLSVVLSLFEAPCRVLSNRSSAAFLPPPCLACRRCPTHACQSNETATQTSSGIKVPLQLQQRTGNCAQSTWASTFPSLDPGFPFSKLVLGAGGSAG